MEKLEENISKLSEWAQDHIYSLQCDLATAKKEHMQARGNVEGETSVSYETSLFQANLPDSTRVEFKLSDKRVLEVYLREMNNEKFLHVYATGGKVIIKPEVTNVVHLTVVSHSDEKED